MKLTMKIVAIVFVMLTVFFFVYASLNYIMMRDYHETAIEREINGAIGSLTRQMAISEELEAYVMGRVDDKNLALSRSIAEIMKDSPQTELASLTSVLEAVEINLTNEKGIIEVSNFSDYPGFDYASSESTKKYIDIISNPALEIAEQPRSDEVSGNMTQYYGVSRKDASGFVQVGFDANYTVEIQEILSIQNSIDDMKVGETGFAFVLQDGAYTAHQQAQKTGENVSEQAWYQSIVSDTRGFSWLTIDGESYYAGYENNNDTIAVICLPKAEYYGQINQFRTNNILMAVLIGLLAVAAIWLTVNHLVIKPVTKLSEDIAELSEGKLNINSNNIHEANDKNQDEIATLKNSFGKLVNASRRQAELICGIADGDLTGSYTPRSDDDVVGHSIVQMLERNNHVMNQVSASTKQLAASTTQIADSSHSLAQGATEQSASVEQLSESVTQIARQTDASVALAERTASLSEAVRQHAETGNRQMQHMMAAVQEINDAGNSISKVIKVIDDIAFQTNILALNAAVEAARAGQHGKGFAVVAEEVRALAAKSAEAAKDTGVLIANSVEKAKLGSQIANETATSLSEIVSEINQSNLLISDIAKSSGEQLQVIKKINNGVEQVSQVIHQNSAAAEESAAASAEMSGQAQTLSGLVSLFRLKSLC